jgi:CHASE2 domain-containing sensor protein
MLINYVGIGSAGAFQTVSFEKLDQTDPSVFKDKIVLVGATDSRSTDVYSTPLSAGTPEIVVFANAVDTLVNGRFIAPMDIELQAAMVFALGLCVFFTTYFAQRKIALGAALGLIVGAKLLADALFSCAAAYVYFVPFACCVPMCFLGASVFKDIKTRLKNPV